MRRISTRFLIGAVAANKYKVAPPSITLLQSSIARVGSNGAAAPARASLLQPCVTQWRGYCSSDDKGSKKGSGKKGGKQGGGGSKKSDTKVGTTDQQQETKGTTEKQEEHEKDKLSASPSATAASEPSNSDGTTGGGEKDGNKDAAASELPAPITPPTTTTEKISAKDMRPRILMAELDKHIVGQQDAKRAVAVALRNRWRRHKVDPDMKDEISPKNILMIGPTGVGKTEIARRLAKLTDAPFVKVEATKFTEVGFHGRDVESIIEDLYKTAVSQAKQSLMRQHEEAARVRAEDRILHALAGAAEGFREHLRSGTLDGLDVTIYVTEKKEPPKQVSPEGFQVSLDIPAMMGLGGKKGRPVKKTMKIKDAFPIVLNEELEKMVETADVQKEALRACEEDGIVVIDEIDKIVTASGGYKGHQASAEGVQQDLLPLIEGTTVTTKNSIQIKTDKILFICSGAFHSVKPSDMLAELQGRLPIRVELKALDKKDFYRILTEPTYNLIKQQIAMLATEEVTLDITDDAKKEIASVAAAVNSSIQNIGARRLITIVERVLEDVNFEGPDMKGQTYIVDAEYVRKAVDPLMKKQDLSRYLL